MDDEDLGFDAEDNEELQNEQRRKEEFARQHPLLKQSKEILSIVSTLLDTCSDERVTAHHGAGLRESAMVVMVKLSSAIQSEDYLISMQNAAIIRDHAEYLRLSNHLLSSSGAFDETYVAMFRREMEQFRLLFREWAQTISKMERDGEDEWGLF